MRSPQNHLILQNPWGIWAIWVRNLKKVTKIAQVAQNPRALMIELIKGKLYCVLLVEQSKWSFRPTNSPCTRPRTCAPARRLSRTPARTLAPPNNRTPECPNARKLARPNARTVSFRVPRSRLEDVSKIFAPFSAVNKEHPFVDKYLFFHFTIDEDKFEEVKKSVTPENTLEEQAKEVLRELALVGPDALLRRALRKLPSQRVSEDVRAERERDRERDQKRERKRERDRPACHVMT